MLPICLFNGTADLATWSILTLLLSGVTQLAWIWLYMIALHRADVTIVMPLMALSPVAAWVLGAGLLAEHPEIVDTIACVIIVCGAVILTYEHQRRRLNLSLLGLTASASALVAITNALFKLGVGSDDAYWGGLYWQSIGTVLFGLLLSLSGSRVREELRAFILDNATLGIGINAANESITLVGNALFSQAILYGQIAIIQSMEALQPVFVFVMGVTLARIAPRYLTEDLTTKATTRKLLGITIICAGTLVLLFRSTHLY